MYNCNINKENIMATTEQANTPEEITAHMQDLDMDAFDSIKAKRHYPSKYDGIYHSIRTMPLNKAVGITLEKEDRAFSTKVRNAFKGHSHEYELKVKKLDNTNRNFAVAKVSVAVMKED